MNTSTLPLGTEAEAIPKAADGAKMRRLAAASSIATTLEWYDFTVCNLMAALVFNVIFFPSFDPLAGTVIAFSTYAVGSGQGGGATHQR
ncbi:hypothetical protein [Pseudomonas fluorescens]|uniref:Proline/betaine transporter n=1 Tax=Pseudomonas fluorescens TaxID=294 RepID=A0A5E7ALN5_PSEFL|nr:hypothetical protein [Pseudomonas fluorescens]VVN79529.1 hypothetical protein PS723_00972 [Pseudomonas fluorescens]